MLAHSLMRSYLLCCILILLAGCAGTAAQEQKATPAANGAAIGATVATTLPNVTVGPIQTETAVSVQTATKAPTAASTVSTQPTSVSPSPALPVGALVLARGALPQRLEAVMIDNHPDAYPQTGLDKAPLVFEALAEFGVTRFMAVFAPGISPNAKVIGPVRSARSYFVQWAMGLHAIYAHAGGSPDGLNLAQSAIEIQNADALRKDAGTYFYRDNSRLAPHNLYTSSASLAQLVSDKGAAGFDGSELGFLIKSDAPVSKRPASQRLNYYFLYPQDPAGWIYDPSSNSYLRTRRGKAHIDGLTGKQLVFKNVVVMEISEGLRQGDPKGRIDQDVTGAGNAFLFIDGTEQQVSWRKDAAFAPLRFYDTVGAEIKLNAGPVWIAALPSLDHLTVQGGGS